VETYALDQKLLGIQPCHLLAWANNITLVRLPKEVSTNVPHGLEGDFNVQYKTQADTMSTASTYIYNCEHNDLIFRGSNMPRLLFNS
jgi:hypothetical protein